jgi:hypothetical protein
MNLALTTFDVWYWMDFGMLVSVWCFTVYILLDIIKISVGPNEHDEY